MATKQKTQKAITENEIKALQDLCQFAKFALEHIAQNPIDRAYLQNAIRQGNKLSDKLINNGYTKD